MSYFPSALDPARRRQTVRRLVKALRAWPVLYDAIAFRGMSGALIAPAVADYLHKTLVLVRNVDIHSHGAPVEYEAAFSRYIIIDDFVASGQTVDAIDDSIRTRLYCGDAVCVGVWCYDEQGLGDNHSHKTYPTYYVDAKGIHTSTQTGVIG